MRTQRLTLLAMNHFISKSIASIVTLTTLVVPLVVSGKVRVMTPGALTPSSFAVTGVLATNPFYRFIGTASYFKERVASDKLEARSEITNEYASRLLRSYQVNAKNEKLMNTALVDYEASAASYKEALLARLQSDSKNLNTEDHFVLCMKHLRLADEVQGWGELSVAQRGLMANTGESFSSLAIALLNGASDVESQLSAYSDLASGKAPLSEQLRIAESFIVLAESAMWKDEPALVAAASRRAQEVITKIASAPEMEVVKVFSEAAGSSKTRFESLSLLLAMPDYAENETLLYLKNSLQSSL